MTMKILQKVDKLVIYNFVINKFHIKGHYHHEIITITETIHTAI